jgi:hypothetical protein
MSTWHLLNGPVTWSDRLAAFWFDTTKADWRESMVMGVRGDQLAGRVGMWWFDARQQFGVVGLVLAVIGVVRLWTISRPWAMLAVLAYAINTIFAFTYNVGDTHVFYLPSHLFTALVAGAALAPFGSRFGGSERTRPALHIIATIAVVVYAGWRAWDTWPAIDRHDDRRAETLVTRLTLGINPQSGVLVTNLNWQLENALLYYSRWQRRDIPWVRLPDVEPHFRFSSGTTKPSHATSSWTRTRRARSSPHSARLFPFNRIRFAPLRICSTRSRGCLPEPICAVHPHASARGAPGCEALRLALEMLTGGHVPSWSTGPYQLMAGLVGEAPASPGRRSIHSARSSGCSTIHSASGWSRGCPRTPSGGPGLAM